MKKNDVVIITYDGGDPEIRDTTAEGHGFEKGALVLVTDRIMEHRGFYCTGIDKSGSEDTWFLTDFAVEKIGEL